MESQYRRKFLDSHSATNNSETLDVIHEHPAENLLISMDSWLNVFVRPLPITIRFEDPVSIKETQLTSVVVIFQNVQLLNLK